MAGQFNKNILSRFMSERDMDNLQKEYDDNKKSFGGGNVYIPSPEAVDMLEDFKDGKGIHAISKDRGMNDAQARTKIYRYALYKVAGR